MRRMSNTISLSVSLILLVSFVTFAGEKSIQLTTQSAEAKEHFNKAMNALEWMENQRVREHANKAVELDPNFAMGWMLVTSVSPGNKRGELIDKAAELAKNASEGERLYIAAMQKYWHRERGQAREQFKALVQKFPGDRASRMMLGQLYMAEGEFQKAEKQFAKAASLDDGSPRVHTLLGTCSLMQDKYGEARALYKKAIAMVDRDATPFQAFFGAAWSHLYESNADGAVKVIEEYLARYNRNGAAQGFPPVWIWNQLGRIHLENGHLEKAMICYETGYKSVPPSQIDSTQKMVWYGRMLHGKARTLAKMGQYEKAWKIAQQIKKMIDEGGEQAERYKKSYHYLAGYIKLEAGDYAAAIEHLEQADQNDAFQLLLLARAYEKAGHLENAKATYRKVVKSTRNNVERALSYPEARQRLAALASY